MSAESVFESWLAMRSDELHEDIEGLIETPHLVAFLLNAVIYDLYNDTKLDSIFLEFGLKEREYNKFHKLVDGIIEYRRENGLVDQESKKETIDILSSFKAWLYQQRHIDINNAKFGILLANDELLLCLLESSYRQLTDEDYLDSVLGQFRLPGKFFIYIEELSKDITRFFDAVVCSSDSVNKEVAVSLDLLERESTEVTEYASRYKTTADISADKSLSRDERSFYINELNLANFMKLADLKEKGETEKAKALTERIVIDNIKLVHSEINRMGIRSRVRDKEELEDYVQTGTIGLLQAIDAYKFEKNNRFSTFAVTCIRNSLRGYIKSNNSQIKVPTKLQQLLVPCQTIKNKLLEMNGEDPTEEEIAEYYNEMNEHKGWPPITGEHVREALTINLNLLSIDQPVSDEDDSVWRDIIIDQDSPRPDFKLDHSLLREELIRSLMNLSPEEEEVISLSFGLRDGIERKPKEISKVINKSPERVRQIIKKTLGTLRNYSNSKNLIAFIYEDEAYFY